MLKAADRVDVDLAASDSDGEKNQEVGPRVEFSLILGSVGG
jgi:hypothetical protein